ncbi:MAG: hypothetical protein IJX47_00790 [Clostridia bacterium]|nr:hypothetical protein [Clostridia bacterium]
MKKRSLILIAALTAVLVVSATVVGTLAYLLDEEQAVNTFTVGNVSISLNETDVDGDGDTQANEYHLVPGAEYVKDPTVTVDARSESSYVRMILTVHNCSAVQAIIDDEINGLADYADLLGGWDETVWLYQGFAHDADANTISFEFRYHTTVDGFDAEGNAADEVLPALFTTLILPDTLDGADLKSLVDGDFKMVVEAHAIQALGFENNEDGAWAAFEEQISR